MKPFNSHVVVLMFLCLTDVVRTTIGLPDKQNESVEMEQEIQSYHDRYPFQNVTLPWNERVNDLVSRLTLHELTLQMARGGAGEYGGPAPAIARLGIGPYNWDTECIRGDVQTAGNATAFPQAIGLAATFSPSLLFEVASATGAEVRGKHNTYVRKGIFASHTGASCFSPVINIMRDPRWGRNQETYGEDPYLSGIMSEHFVKGLQGNDKRFIQASAGCKHFDVHGGPENIPVSRLSFDAQVSSRDWHMTFLPAFRKCVQAGTYSLMCSYNSINGQPACANKKLLTDILRKAWGFKGYVVSDEGAEEFMITKHHYFNNTLDTAIASVQAGCNLELSGNHVDPVFLDIETAVKQDKLSEDLVRERVKPLFYTRMKLGEFDPQAGNPYAKLDSQVAESRDHQNLAIKAATKSFVLLKNNHNFLPLSPSYSSRAAILGPMANNVDQLFGDYSPSQDRSFTKTPYQGLKELYAHLQFGTVCNDSTPCQKYNASKVHKLVANVDVIFLCLGTGQIIENEGRDRKNLELPGHQHDLLVDVIKYSNNTPIVLLLFNAGPLNITLADESDAVVSIMECFFPSQATGDALVYALVNKGGFTSPAGRLPSTWPKYDWQIPAMVNYSMIGRTYRYFQGDPLYPFGYGLSYSIFQYSHLNFNKTIKAGDNMEVSFVVTNVGSTLADEVYQCYISWANQSLPVPQRQLVAVSRVSLLVDQHVNIKVTIDSEWMAYWDKEKWIIQKGLMNLYCGGQQPFQKKRSPSNILSGQFIITNTARMDRLSSINS